MTWELRPASSLDLERLAGLFTSAYEDYLVPFALGEQQLRTMVDVFDLDLDASRVAVRGGEPVGLANLGIRRDRGWIGGVGVVRHARRLGLGEVLMRAVHEQARARGLREVWLEVMVANERALPLYEKLGYVTTRDVDVWSLDAADDAGEPRTEADEVPWDDAHARISESRHEREPWQRSDETVANHDDLRGLVADDAASVFRVADGRVTLLQARGSLGGVRTLVAAMRAHGPVTALNFGPDSAVSSAFRDLGGRHVVRQHEMVLRLA